MAIIPSKLHKQIRSQIEHEDHLANHRITWLLALNGFLFTAYGFSITAEATALTRHLAQESATNYGIVVALSNHATTDMIYTLRKWLAIAGFWTSLLLFIGINSANATILNLARKWNETVTGNANYEYPPICGDRCLAVFGGMLPHFLLPLGLSFVWTQLYQLFTCKTLIVIYIGILIFVGLLFGKAQTLKLKNPSNNQPISQ